MHYTQLKAIRIQSKYRNRTTFDRSIRSFIDLDRKNRGETNENGASPKKLHKVTI